MASSTGRREGHPHQETYDTVRLIRPRRTFDVVARTSGGHSEALVGRASEAPALASPRQQQLSPFGVSSSPLDRLTGLSALPRF
jgi:hypothetical protein